MTWNQMAVRRVRPYWAALVLVGAFLDGSTYSVFAQRSSYVQHVVVLSDSTARVDQTNGPKYGPNERRSLWPNSLVRLLREASSLKDGGSGLLAIEGNALSYDREMWTVAGPYEFDKRIGPFQKEITRGGRIPAHGATAALREGATASLAKQRGKTLWIYWAACPDNRAFEVVVDGRATGSFGQEQTVQCEGRRTAVFSGKMGDHTAVITAPRGNVFLYGAEWSCDEGGLVVDNLAVGGATTTFYNSAAKLAFLRVIPHVTMVILAIGINDYAHEVPPPVYRENLEVILGEIHRASPSARVVLVNQYPIFGDDRQNGAGLAQQVYWGITRSIATQKRLMLVSLPDAWGSFAAIREQGYLTSDLVHPSDRGSEQMAAVIAHMVTSGGRVDKRGTQAGKVAP